MLLPPLTRGRIIKRYKRFLADVVLDDGSQVTAHCPNTGSMRGCWEPDAPVQLSHSDNPKRKLAWTLERVDMGKGWVGVNTARTNAVVAEAVIEGKVPSLAGYEQLKREVKFEVP
ncbi:MAG: sugar fermentation stimulation protein SfsA, partial [Sedimenticola sp.]